MLSVVQANRVSRSVRNPYSTINVTPYGKVTQWGQKNSPMETKKSVNPEYLLPMQVAAKLTSSNNKYVRVHTTQV